MSRESDILDNLGLVRLMAARRHSLLPHSVQLCDLVQDGICGLIAAVDDFDPSKRVQFEFYAKHRIRGAMLDGLRLVDPLSRDHRRAVSSGLAAPVVTLQFDLREFNKAESPDPGPEQLASNAEDSRLLWAAVATLPPRWALVLEMYFRDGISLLQIGKALGFNESRACGIKTLALDRLRGMPGMKKWGGDALLRSPQSVNGGF